MTTTVQKRLKEHKRQEKQRAKAEVRRNKTLAKRAQQDQGPATADADIDSGIVSHVDDTDIDSPTQ